MFRRNNHYLFFITAWTTMERGKWRWRLVAWGVDGASLAGYLRKYEEDEEEGKRRRSNWNLILRQTNSNPKKPCQTRWACPLHKTLKPKRSWRLHPLFLILTLSFLGQEQTPLSPFNSFLFIFFRFTNQYFFYYLIFISYNLILKTFLLNKNNILIFFYITFFNNTFFITLGIHK